MVKYNNYSGFMNLLCAHAGIMAKGRREPKKKAPQRRFFLGSFCGLLYGLLYGL